MNHPQPSPAQPSLEEQYTFATMSGKLRYIDAMMDGTGSSGGLWLNGVPYRPETLEEFKARLAKSTGDKVNEE